MSIHLKPNTPASFAPGQTFLILLSYGISVWKENPAQLFAATFCVCNQPKIPSVLLTPSSTCSLPEWCIYNAVSKSSSFLTLPRKLLPSASQQCVTSTSQSNSNTVCSDIYKLTPVCSLISSSHGGLKLTFFSQWTLFNPFQARFYIFNVYI